MAFEVFLAIDAGGTAVKAAVYDVDGRCRGRRRGPVASIKEGPISEQNPDMLWSLAAGLVREVLDDGDFKVLAVGTTGFGNGLFLLDERGNAVRPAIRSDDTRSSEIVRAWRASGIETDARRATHHAVWPGQPAALTAWLSEHEPAALAQATVALCCKDFLRFRLTGEASLDITDASSAALIELEAGGLATDLLDGLGAADLVRLLPPLVEPTAIVGALTAAAAEATALPAGIPVVAGMADGLAAALGLGIADESTLSLVSGTWSLNQRFTKRLPAVDAELFGAHATFEPGRWLVFDNAVGGAAVLESQLPKGRDRAAVYEQWNAMAADDRRGGSGFYFPSCPHEPTSARSLYEGVAFEHRLHTDRLVRATGPAREARLAGGAAASSVWRQILADVLSLPLVVSADDDAGALGVAMAASVALGVHAGVAEAVSSMSHHGRVVAPDPNAVNEYDEIFTRWCAARELVEVAT